MESVFGSFRKQVYSLSLLPTEGVHRVLFWIPVITQRETFTRSRALDVLQMKEEDVLEFFAAGTHLGGNNVDFKV